MVAGRKKTGRDIFSEDRETRRSLNRYFNCHRLVYIVFDKSSLMHVYIGYRNYLTSDTRSYYTVLVSYTVTLLTYRLTRGFDRYIIVNGELSLHSQLHETLLLFLIII